MLVKRRCGSFESSLAGLQNGRYQECRAPTFTDCVGRAFGIRGSPREALDEELMLCIGY